MSTIVIALFSVVAFFFVFGLAHDTAAMGRFTSALSDLGMDLEDFADRAMNLYDTRIQPIIRRLGYVSMGFSAVAFFGGFLLLANSSALSFESAFLLDVVLLVVTAGGGFLVWRAMDQTKILFSTSDLASAIFAGFAAQGLLLFLSGVGAKNQSLAMLGVAYILMAREVFFLMLKVYAKLASYGVDIAEGGSNFLLKTVIGLVSKKSFEELVAPGGVNIANQERFVPMVAGVEKKSNLLLYPFLAIGILTVSFTWLGLIALVSMVTYFVFGILEGEGIDITDRRKRSAIGFEILAYLLLVFAVASVFIPGFGPAITTVLDGAGAWLVGFVRDPKAYAPASFEKPLIALVAGLGACFFLVPASILTKAEKKDGDDATDAPMPIVDRLRLFAAAPFAILALVGLAGLTAHFLFAKDAQAATSVVRPATTAPSASASGSTVVGIASSASASAHIPPQPAAPVTTATVTSVKTPPTAATPCPDGKCEHSPEAVAMCKTLKIPCD